VIFYLTDDYQLLPEGLNSAAYFSRFGVSAAQIA
jgi:hypothetical protein